MNKLFKFSAIKFFLMGLILFNAHNSFAHGATEKVEIEDDSENINWLLHKNIVCTAHT